MKSFTATANGSGTIGWAYYGSSSWSTGSSNGARQGSYHSSSSSNSRVGVMVFSGAGAALTGKSIKKITFTITTSKAGYNRSKTISFRKANYQYLNTGVKGSAQVGASLGGLSGTFYGTTLTFTLNSSSNTALFNNLAAYFKAGNSALSIYNGETSSSSSYSSNYLCINSCAMTVEYETGTVYYYTDSAWKRCSAYYWTNGQWVKCVPYYCDSGEWKKG
jgi:hypothetical protein